MKYFSLRITPAAFLTAILPLLLSVRASAAAKNPLDHVRYAYTPSAPGSKPVSMGESFVSVANTLDCIYWNPAGILGIEKKMSFMINVSKQSEAPWPDVVADDPLKGGHFTYFAMGNAGLSVSYRPIADLTDKVIPDPAVPGTTLDIEMKLSEYSISFANTLNKKKNAVFGMNINFFSGSMGVVTATNGAGVSANVSGASGYGLDWGLLYRISDDVMLGLSCFNWPSEIYWDDYENATLPTVVRGGFSFLLNRLLLFTTEVELQGNAGAGNEIYHLGLDQQLGNNFRLRGGMYSNDWNRQNGLNMTGGLGFTKDGKDIDFAVRKSYPDRTAGQQVLDYSVTLAMPF